MIQNGNFFVSNSEFWPFFLKNRNSEAVIGLKEVDEAKKIDIFNEFVNVVYIELSSFCNRSCDYCPVGQFPRVKRFMKDEIREKILAELERIDYRNTISLSHFNEPLADEHLIDRIREIHRRLPYCYIRMNSNGDYLTHELLDTLSDAGCREIQMTTHFAPGEEYTDEEAKAKIDKFFARIGLTYEIKSMKPGHNITVDFVYKNVRLLVLANNWKIDGNSRGGIVDDLNCENRRFACSVPFREVTIDVDGDMRRCPNMYETAPVIANVANIGLVEYYFSKEVTDIRRDMLMYRDDRKEPCVSCNTFDYSADSDADKWNKNMKDRFGIDL